MKKLPIETKRELNVTIWDCLVNDQDKQAAAIVLRKRFPRFKPPPERLPPMESEEEIGKIMRVGRAPDR